MQRLNLIIYNLCKYFSAKGFKYLDVPLIVGGLVRRDLTSAMQIITNSEIKMVYKYGVVLRPERYCDLGRFRQFVQFDFDILGVSSVLADIYTVWCVCDLINMLDCKKYVKCVLNTKRVLLGFAEILGLLCYTSKRTKLLTILDKSSVFKFTEIINLLNVGKFDISGDFIPGLGLRVEFLHLKLDLMIGLFNQTNRSSNLILNVTFLLLRDSYFGEFGTREMLYYNNELLVCGLLESFVTLKPLLSRGLTYYTSTILEVMSDIVLMSEKNTFVKIGSLLGGGRFDHYVSSFAVGCSLGITRSITFLNCVKHKFIAQIASRDVYVCVNSSENFNLVQTLLTNVLVAFGYNVKILFNLSLALALKLAHKDSMLLFYSSGGWLVKLLFKRAYLQPRVLSPILWRFLNIDQFWINNNNVLTFIRSLLPNLKKRW